MSSAASPCSPSSQSGQRTIPRGIAQRARRGLLQHRERRIQARADRMRPQHPRAEAVDRRDPCRLGLARVLAAAELDEALAHPRPQLAGGAVGERDREDPRRPHAVLDHRAHEALDQHGRLAAAGVGLEQQRPRARADRGRLLLGERPAARTYQAKRAHDAEHRQIVGYTQPVPFQPHVCGRGSRAPAPQLADRAQHVLDDPVDRSPRSPPARGDPSRPCRGRDRRPRARARAGAGRARRAAGRGRRPGPGRARRARRGCTSRPGTCARGASSPPSGALRPL